MTRLRDIKIPARPGRASLTVDPRTAALVRRVAVAEGRGKDIGGLLGDMLRVYVQQEHPDWGGDGDEPG